MTLIDEDARALPTSSCCDPHVAAVLDAADAHIAWLDAVLDENERIMLDLRDGTSWSSPTARLVTA